MPWGGACVASRFSPQLDDKVAEAVRDGCVLGEAGLAVDVADGSNPLGHPIEFSELVLERSEHRKSGHACSIALVECQVAADDALNKWCGPVEGSMPGDVGEPGMYLHELLVARRDDRRG